MDKKTCWLSLKCLIYMYFISNLFKILSKIFELFALVNRNQIIEFIVNNWWCVIFVGIYLKNCNCFCSKSCSYSRPFYFCTQTITFSYLLKIQKESLYSMKGHTMCIYMYSDQQDVFNDFFLDENHTILFQT